MALIVIDASAALYAAASRHSLLLSRDMQLVAPPLMWSEALSVLHESRWRREISQHLAEETRNRLLSANIERANPDNLYVEAWRIAEELGWAKTYDAEYVALARLLDAPLLTVDERLRRAAGRIVRIMGPADI